MAIQKFINNMKKNLISIILIVKNDKGVLDTITYLKKLPDKPEIIVVDASTDESFLRNDKTNTIKIVKYRNTTKKRITIPEQRNVGVKSTTGSIIIFIDANCVAEKEWLTELTRYIIDGTEDIVAGTILSSTDDKHHDTRNLLLKGKKYLSEAPTMNLAIKKEVFEKIGYFDETFDYGSDVDFTMRATENGYKIRYNPKAILYHNWGSLKEEMKRAFRYGEARINILRRRKKSIMSILREDPITVIYPLYIMLLPISIIIPLYPLLLLIPLIKNRNNYPIKTSFLNLVYGLGILYKLIKLL